RGQGERTVVGANAKPQGDARRPSGHDACVRRRLQSCGANAACRFAFAPRAAGFPLTPPADDHASGANPISGSLAAFPVTTAPVPVTVTVAVPFTPRALAVMVYGPPVRRPAVYSPVLLRVPWPVSVQVKVGCVCNAAPN